MEKILERLIGWIIVSVCVAGCPFADPVERPLESGCIVCPPGHRCETVDDDVEGSSPIVKCIPSEPEEALGDAADTDALFRESASCDTFGCPCVEDADCASQYCVQFGGDSICSRPCAAGCLDTPCPDSCPGESFCSEDDEGNSSCSPE